MFLSELFFVFALFVCFEGADRIPRCLYSHQTSLFFLCQVKLLTVLSLLQKTSAYCISCRKTFTSLFGADHCPLACFETFSRFPFFTPPLSRFVRRLVFIIGVACIVHLLTSLKSGGDEFACFFVIHIIWTGDCLRVSSSKLNVCDSNLYSA